MAEEPDLTDTVSRFTHDGDARQSVLLHLSRGATVDDGFRKEARENPGEALVQEGYLLNTREIAAAQKFITMHAGKGDADFVKVLRGARNDTMFP